ncbi:Gfo/Idh/MocA family oxidoreductase [Actinotalea sp.]|uniref:Gfo/Idh/MocA family protein n=1 Tax=Actinotalea sp. TaxID=1872145 RepID=UPI0035629544
MVDNATLRTGIIGYGLSGQVFHEPFLATNPTFSIDLVATSDPGRQALASAHYPVVATPAELLARAGELDLVVLASPAHTHLEQGLAALEAGAAVVVDKPFAASVAEATQLVEAAERLGRPLFVFQNRRWDGDFRTVRAVVESGLLGRVHRFESTFERFPQPRAGRWQDTTTPAQGGGITFDLGSHLVDQALQLFGPAELECAELAVLREGGRNEDDAFLSLRHESGVRSHITVSRAAGQSGPRFRVLGTEGAYSVDGLDLQETLLKAGGRPTDEGYGQTPESAWGRIGVAGSPEGLVPYPTLPGTYADFYAGVAATIRDGAPTPVEPRDALAAFRILEQAHAMSR